MKKNILFVLILVLLIFQNVQAATINRMTIHTFGDYRQTYDPNNVSTYENKFNIFGMADTYYLSDGTFWESGAGSHVAPRVDFVDATMIDSTIKYTFDPPEFYVIFQNTDYNSGDHSTGGALKIDDDPVVSVTNGAKLATMEGYAEIISNYPANNPNFDYYSASVGDKVFYSMEYWIYDTYWTSNTFDNNFEYNLQGYVDFTNVIPEPSIIFMFLWGFLGCYWMKKKTKISNE